MSEKSFKERVKEAAIENAAIDEMNMVGYEYLVCSSAFQNGYLHIPDNQCIRPGRTVHCSA